MWGLSRLGGLALAAAVGWAVAVLTGARFLTDSPAYLVVATSLLAVGLYSSTAGIDLADLRRDASTVLLAVTVGVMAKAAIIAGTMYLVFREPQYIVLGLAVAQIDPLAVAAMNHESSLMSPRGRSLLAAWASFDDPITVLLTVYGTAWVLNRHPSDPGAFGAASGSAVLGLSQNAALAAVAFVIWLGLRRLRPEDNGGTRRPTRLGTVVEVVVLLALAAGAVMYSLALAIAIIGLFFRPAIGRAVAGATRVAFLAATLLLGFALAGGVNFWAGLVLGLCAFAAQMVVGGVIPARLGRHDRVRLAFGQQNGITAVILALLLEPEFPGSVGVVAPAILVVALLHALSNGVLDKRSRAATTATGMIVAGAADPVRPADPKTSPAQ